MVLGLVDNLRPVSRVQTQHEDVVLRAGIVQGSYAFRGAEVLRWDMSNYASFTIIRHGIGIVIAVQGSDDGVHWDPIEVRVIGRYARPINSTGIGMAPVASNQNGTRVGGVKQGRFVRIVQLGAESGGTACAVTVVLSQNPLPPSEFPGAPIDEWKYVAPSGGVTGTTAVVIKTSTANNYTRLYMSRIHLVNGGTSGTEVIFACGSTIIWRTYLAAGAVVDAHFEDIPILGIIDATNGGITMQLTAASGAVVYANITGSISV